MDHILQDLAHALDAPIATLTLTDDGKIWKAQCGVPPDLAPGLESIKQVLDRSIARNQSRIVIEDIAKDSRFAGLRLNRENGIQFCAREPLLNRNGKAIGSLLALDTRTRRMGAQEEELLHAAAIATMEALEVRAVSPRPES